MSRYSLKFGRYFEEMQLTSVQWFRTWGLNIFSCHFDEVLCGVSSWILFSPSFIWNVYACQSSPPCPPWPSPPTPPQVLWALESEMKDWIHKIWIICLNCGRSRCDSSARLVQVVTPISPRANVLTTRLLLSSALLWCYFSGRTSAETRPVTVICHPRMITQSES